MTLLHQISGGSAFVQNISQKLKCNRSFISKSEYLKMHNDFFFLHRRVSSPVFDAIHAGGSEFDTWNWSGLNKNFNKYKEVNTNMTKSL